MPLGVENTDGKIDGRDQIEYAAEYMASYQNQQDAGHRFYHRLRSTNPWPDSIQPDLRPAITEYVSRGLDVAGRLHDAMCLALNVDPRELARFFAKSDDEEPNFWSIKLVSYPPISNETHASSMAESLQGVGAHTDSNFLTLICQDQNSSGLQVQHVGGASIDVPQTPPNVFICNIGELSELWTGGYFLATPHQVLRYSSNAHSRTSIPIFYNLKLDSAIEPFNTNDLLWERQGQNQMRRNQNKLIHCVGENSIKSLARSHPKVFARHHGDLRILEDDWIVM
ncbi:hypothetical protein ACHAW5_010699 [Stephanodiscus triporus]|uniref:Fe2OG dioxygenase domain-containing protein n=1 Tax=Stephanodiscus triporus TaxID=2934178 RepID=A0ABD3MPH4_9STRA